MDTASKAISQLFTEEQAFTWQEDPLTASYEGQRAYDDRLESALPADFERRAGVYAKFLDRLRAIDRARLSGEDQISYDLFDFILTCRVKFAAYKEWRAPLYSDSGFHTAVMQMHEAADTQNVIGYERYISRLNDVKRYFAENIANMRQGLKDGYTLPAAILPGVASIIDAQQFADPEDSPLYGPFKAFPHLIPAADQVRLKEAGKAAINSAVIPAYRDFQTFFRNEYMPQARKTIAASALPNGKAYYQDLVRYYATYDITPDEVHEIGLTEVARIRAEMEASMKIGEVHGNLRGLPRLSSQRPAVLRQDADGPVEGRELHRQGDRRKAAAVLRQAAAHDLPRRGGARRHSRLTTPPGVTTRAPTTDARRAPTGSTPTRSTGGRCIH